jgi:hypothetical protein
MPRLPTGHSRGGPTGNGRRTPARLGAEAQIRVTVRLPTVLYDRLEAFAAGRHVHRGRPPLTQCVREAVEEYLDRQHQRQIPTTAEEPCATYSTLAAASLEVAQDRWTPPREAPPPREGTDAPALQAGDELLSKPAVVALILCWYEEGMTKTAIVTRLNTAHVPPIVGMGHWNSRKVNRALWYGLQRKRERQAFLARYAPTTAPALGRER